MELTNMELIKPQPVRLNAETPTRPASAPTRNLWPGTCASCKQAVDPGRGELHEEPIRVVCLVCILKSGVREDGLRERLRSYPRTIALPGESSRELNPLPFQVEDAWRTHLTRALLLAQQPGCGKTIILSLGGLRTDMLNLVISPASVRENWRKEIEIWRPDLKTIVLTSQDGFNLDLANAQEHDLKGVVLVCSFGALPGSPCPGCANLRRRLEKLQKAKRYHGEIVPKICTHFGPESPHPDEIELRIDGTLQSIPYTMGKAAIRWQRNPTPEITRKIVLVADECHAFKISSTQRTRNFRALRERVWAAGGHVYGLSGTPCEGKPEEFYQVLVSLGLEHAAFGEREHFERIFRHWFSNSKGSRQPPQGDLLKELTACLKPIRILRRRQDVLGQLPPRVEEVVELEIGQDTIKEVNEAVHRLLAVRRSWDEILMGAGSAFGLLDPFDPRIEDDEREARRKTYEERVEHYFEERPWGAEVEDVEEVQTAVREALLFQNKLPPLRELSKIRSLLSNAKLAAVEEWLGDREEEQEPIVLFAQHLAVLRRVAEHRPGWGFFHGGLDPKKRFELVEKFQAGQIERGLAVSIGAGGVGVTLTRARVCAFVDLSWNPATNYQAESRLIRIGAEKHDSIVIVKFVAKHAVDRLVVETLREKERLLTAFEVDDREAE